MILDSHGGDYEKILLPPSTGQMGRGSRMMTMTINI
jgi:hypothetical protein